MNRRRSIGAWIGVSIALVVIVPVCGWLFACGCDWPWRGLVAHCNYFDPASVEKCPWCVHPPMGAFVVAIATLLGGFVGARAASFARRRG